MSIGTGLGEKERAGVVKILQRTLADEYLLLVKTKNYHWNVVGPDFGELHKFFDEQYEKLSEFTDEVAERTRSLGAKTAGTLSEFLKLATLKERPGHLPAAKGMIEDLLHDHEQLVRNLREDVDAATSKFHDAGTSDFLTGLMEEHEKMAWMLRAYLA